MNTAPYVRAIVNHATQRLRLVSATGAHWRELPYLDVYTSFESWWRQVTSQHSIVSIEHQDGAEETP